MTKNKALQDANSQYVRPHLHLPLRAGYGVNASAKVRRKTEIKKYYEDKFRWEGGKNELRQQRVKSNGVAGKEW